MSETTKEAMLRTLQKLKDDKSGRPLADRLKEAIESEPELQDMMLDRLKKSLGPADKAAGLMKTIVSMTSGRKEILSVVSHLVAITSLDSAPYMKNNVSMEDDAGRARQSIGKKSGEILDSVIEGARETGHYNMMSISYQEKIDELNGTGDELK